MLTEDDDLGTHALAARGWKVSQIGQAHRPRTEDSAPVVEGIDRLRPG